MNKYQITLTPVDRFFFGGDMTFKVGSDSKFNDRYSSYIIRSLKLPQQTSLLGMLRFLILRNAGDEVFKNGKIIDKTKAKRLIGSKSFSVNKEHTENDFGIIKRLSHVKIREMNNGQITDLEFMPLYEKDLSFINSSSGTINFNSIRIPALEEYNAKEPFVAKLTDKKKFDDHFIEDRRMGINRDVKTGKTEDDALFKQISYRFNNKDGHRYCFVFETEVEESITLEEYSGQMVSLGGDNSQFIISISKEIKDACAFQTKENAVYALSPLFLNSKEAALASFAITQLIPFRFLESEMDKANTYHILSNELKRSHKYELYMPGSVFYFEDEEKKKGFIKMIESKKEFRQIGYNEYK